VNVLMTSATGKLRPRLDAAAGANVADLLKLRG
jgi:hypothetical protein